MVVQEIKMVIFSYIFSFQGNIPTLYFLWERPKPPRPPSKQRGGRERKIEKGECKRNKNKEKLRDLLQDKWVTAKGSMGGFAL